MIPYFEYHAIITGPIVLQVWGLWVSLGVVVGMILADRLANKLLLSRQIVWDLGLWSLLGGLISARIFFVLFYSPAYFWSHPVEVLYLWQGGASSLGGFVGAVLAIYIFLKIKKFAWAEILPYADILSLSLWLGWGIGRIGCFFIHDHPGKLSNFFLAVNFPTGARFDLGLMDSLLSFVLFAVFALLFKKITQTGWGRATLYSWMAYAFVRFWLDFLRVGDALYFYLTPAQWGLGLLVVALTGWFVWSKIRST